MSRTPPAKGSSGSGDNTVSRDGSRAASPATVEQRIAELEQSNRYMSYLLHTIDIAAIFIDSDQSVRHVSAECSKLLHLDDEDVGTEISRLGFRIADPGLAEDARAVSDTGERMEKDVHFPDGRTFLRRIFPRRIADGEINGVVVTYSDITSLHAAYMRTAKGEQQQAAVAKLGSLALKTDDLQELVDYALRALRATLRCDYVKILQYQPARNSFLLRSGIGWKAGVEGHATVSADRDSQAGYTLRHKGPVVVDDLRADSRFSGPPLLAEHDVRSGVSVLVGNPQAPWGVLGAHSRRRQHFTMDDANFVQAVANVLSEAMEGIEAERKIADREEQLRLVTDSLPLLLAYIDRDYVYRYCNTTYGEWFGLNIDDIVGKSVSEVIGDAAFATVRPKIEQALSGEQTVFEGTLKYLHGGPRQVQVNYMPHLSDGGEVLGFYAMIQDISERARAHMVQARLAAIIEGSKDAIVAKDLDGNITDWNDAAEKLYGYTAAEVIGRNVAMLVPEDRRDELRQVLDNARAGKPTRLETVRRSKSGDLVNILLTVSPIRDADGSIVGASAIARDITERLAIERELSELTERLEERVAERTAVAERRAVELRGLAMQVTDAEQRAKKRLAQAIHDDLQQLIVAANMRLPRIDNPSAPGDMEKVSMLLGEALDRCRTLVSELRPPILKDGSLADVFLWLKQHMADKHDLDISLEMLSTMERMDEQSKALLYEVALELLFNVVKHAETSQASLCVNTTDEGIHLTVSDAGVGFDPDQDNGLSTTGFGLFSVRERVEALGGNFVCHAAPGEGTRFEITLPADFGREIMAPLVEHAGSHEPSDEKARQGNGAGSAIRVLVADDHQIFREGLLRILDLVPEVKVVGEAADGEEAVARAAALQPDLIVMDISMPRMNGIDATRLIKSRNPGIVIIGLSLHSEDDLGGAMKKAGAAEFVPKESASTGLVDALISQFSLQR